MSFVARGSGLVRKMVFSGFEVPVGLEEERAEQRMEKFLPQLSKAHLQTAPSCYNSQFQKRLLQVFVIRVELNQCFPQLEIENSDRCRFSTVAPM